MLIQSCSLLDSLVLQNSDARGGEKSSLQFEFPTELTHNHHSRSRTLTTEGLVATNTYSPFAILPVSSSQSGLKSTWYSSTTLVSRHHSSVVLGCASLELRRLRHSKLAPAYRRSSLHAKLRPYLKSRRNRAKTSKLKHYYLQNTSQQ